MYEIPLGALPLTVPPVSLIASATERAAVKPRRRDRRACAESMPPTPAEREAARIKAASYGRLLESHRVNTELALEKSAAFAPEDPAGRGARHEAAVRMTFYEKWLAEYKRLLAIAQNPREVSTDA